MKTALLVLDIQNRIVDRMPDAVDRLLPALRMAVAGARTHSVPVIYVKLAFRRNAPDVSPHSRTFATIAQAKAVGVTEHDPGTDIHPSIAPSDDDIIVVKKRISAFTGSDLDVVLRSLDVRTVVLTGIATSGAVASTLYQAADLDYELTVLEDCCTDPDEEVHQLLMDRLFPRHAAVVNADQWLSRLSHEVAHSRSEPAESITS